MQRRCLIGLEWSICSFRCRNSIMYFIMDSWALCHGSYHACCFPFPVCDFAFYSMANISCTRTFAATAHLSYCTAKRQSLLVGIVPFPACILIHYSSNVKLQFSLPYKKVCSSCFLGYIAKVCLIEILTTNIQANLLSFLSVK